MSTKHETDGASPGIGRYDPRRAFEAVALNPQPLPPGELYTERFVQLAASLEAVRTIQEEEIRRTLEQRLETSLRALEDWVCGTVPRRLPHWDRIWWRIPPPPPPDPYPIDVAERVAIVAVTLPAGAVQDSLRQIAGNILRRTVGP